MEVAERAATRQPRRAARLAVCIPGAIAAAGILDLAARQVARQSLIDWLGGGGWSSSSVLGVVLGACSLLLVALWRGSGPSRANRVVGVLLVAAFASGLVAQQALGARLQSDGFYYFSYLRSLWFDHDVDFTNDYRALGLGDKAGIFQ